jgi:hypothetical protein
MKQLLTDIQTRLQAYVPQLAYIDEDWGQMDYYSVAQPVKFPCALINIGTIVYTDQGKGVQTGIGTVIITVADIKLTNSSANAPLLQKQAAWKVYDTIQSVHQALHGWTGSPFYGPLTRTQLHRRKNDEGINLFDVVFTVSIRDDSARGTKLTKSPVAIQIQGPEIGLIL